ncbi:MAG: hypothetical protein J5764_03925, partial [Bacteroidales bacterium]|nr:hypothetical protein [Bacteroidales bacterium]
MKVVFSAVAALLCLNACSLKEAPESHYMVLEAGINDSRTVLDDITKVLWQDTDEICVNGQKSTSVTLSEDCSLAQFTLPLLDPPFEAIYPASAWVEGKAVLPEQQRYVPQSFDPRAALMLSYSASGNSMFFSHASSYLKISVANAGGAAIKRIEVHSIGDEDMAGSFGADFQNSCLVRESASGKYVTLLPREGESTLPFGEPLYIAVAPGTYASGIRVRIVDEEYHYADISSYKSFTAEAGRVYRTSMDFTPTGTVIDSEMPEIAPP